MNQVQCKKIRDKNKNESEKSNFWFKFYAEKSILLAKKNTNFDFFAARDKNTRKFFWSMWKQKCKWKIKFLNQVLYKQINLFWTKKFAFLRTKKFKKNSDQCENKKCKWKITFLIQVLYKQINLFWTLWQKNEKNCDQCENKNVSEKSHFWFKIYTNKSIFFKQKTFHL